MIYGKKSVAQLRAENEEQGALDEHLVTRAVGDDGLEDPPVRLPEDDAPEIPQDLLDRMAALIKADRTPAEIGEAIGNPDLAIDYYMHYMAAHYDEAGTVCEGCETTAKVETCRCLWAAPIKTRLSEKLGVTNQGTRFHRFETWHCFCGRCLLKIKSRRGLVQFGMALLFLVILFGGLFFLPFLIITLALAFSREIEWSILYATLGMGVVIGLAVWGIVVLRKLGPPAVLRDIGRHPFALADIV